MGLIGFFKRSKQADQAHSLYTAVVGQARRPVFYSRLGVPDSVDGRYELIVIHGALLLSRLRGEAAAGVELGQVIFDLMIDDLDQSLREMGVGDLSVGRRVKAMARAFYGRASVYEAAMSDDDDQALIAALERNLFGTVPEGEGDSVAVAAYMRGVSLLLEGQSGAALLGGSVDFGDAPGDDR